MPSDILLNFNFHALWQLRHCLRKNQAAAQLCLKVRRENLRESLAERCG